MLPEHRANTVAKFAIGSPTGTTWGLLVGYLLAGALVLLATRFLVGRISVAQLGGDR